MILSSMTTSVMACSSASSYSCYTQKASYTVYYKEYGTNKVIAAEKSVTGKTAGTTVTETAKAITGYKVHGDSTKSLRLTTSTCGNVITFYYEK